MSVFEMLRSLQAKQPSIEFKCCSYFDHLYFDIKDQFSQCLLAKILQNYRSFS